MRKIIPMTFILALFASSSMAQTMVNYEVSITNLTPGQFFTPQMVMTHSQGFQMFRMGESASSALEALAEGGDAGPLMESAHGSAMDMAVIPGLLGPGETATVVVAGDPDSGFLSVAAMLLPTNDTFVAVNRLRLPMEGGKGRMLSAYDAGTEHNSQSCQHIPGPRCGGEPVSAENMETDEGFIHISNGFHDLGDIDDDGFEVLGPVAYDWRNFVARVTVRRMN